MFPKLGGQGEIFTMGMQTTSKGVAALLVLQNSSTISATQAPVSHPVVSLPCPLFMASLLFSLLFASVPLGRNIKVLHIFLCGAIWLSLGPKLTDS